MCWIDECDPVDFYKRDVRTARMEHECGECGRTIAAGEKYEYVSMLYEGSWWPAKTCEHCMWARQWLSVACGGFVHHGVMEELEEHWLEDVLYRTLDLGRRILLIRSRYMRHGELIPVPTSTPRIPEHA